MKRKICLTILVMLLAGTLKSFSQDMERNFAVTENRFHSEAEKETPQTVIANVHKAVALLKEKGSAAMAELCDPKSEYNDRDGYLFIIDVDSSLVVNNPRFPERTGGNIREHLDWAGKKYGVELCEVALNGGGWIEFVWPKPGSNEGQRKISYIYPVPGMRYTICAGVYNDDMSIDELNAMTGHKKARKVAVIFEVTPTEEGTPKYFELGGMLKGYLQKMPGFISVERFESVNNPGKYLSLSFWESEEAAAGWRKHINHRASQKQGHDRLFKDYRISVGHIVREYTKDNRTEAPADSNAAIINE